MDRLRILHITGYMGDAGIGKAISGLVLNDAGNEHRIIALERSLKRREITRCIDGGIVVMEEPSWGILCAEIESCDVVILHWWHYPPVARLLAEFPEIPCRVILWSHVSGCNYPYLSADFIRCFDRTFFTSPYAYENPMWTKDETCEIRLRSDVVYGLSDIQTEACKVDYELKYDSEDVAKQVGESDCESESGNNEELLNDESEAGESDCKSESCNVSRRRFDIIYVGTFTESKLSGEFADICEGITARIPESRFIMLGDDTRADWVKRRLEEKGIADHVEWRGFVSDVYEQLQRADVFMYPLNPFHFGTTENVILEAMTVGLPIVLFNQAAEKYIIENNVDGLLADNADDMIEAVVRLFEDRELRSRLGIRARQTVKDKFLTERNVDAFVKGVAACMKEAKCVRRFGTVTGSTPHEWFTSAMLPCHKEFFEGAASGGDVAAGSEEFVEDATAGSEKFVGDVAACVRDKRMPAIFSEKTKSSVYHFMDYYEDEELKTYAARLEENLHGVHSYGE